MPPGTETTKPRKGADRAKVEKRLLSVAKEYEKLRAEQARMPLREQLGLLPGYDPFARCDGYDFDDAAAQLAIDFFHECLSFSQGARARTPFVLEPWQRAWVGNLFGWKCVRTGNRRYRHSLMYVPRKNGKSETVAGVSVKVIATEDEPGAQGYCAASKFDQAMKTVMTPVKKMIRAEPMLARRCDIWARSIVFGDRVLMCIGANAAGEHGGSTHYAVIDELHALGDDRELVDVIDTSTLARSNPLILYTTTADYERASICNEIHERAGLVRDGIIDDPRFLPAIYEARHDDDWHDPRTWFQANPNLGVSFSYDAFLQMYLKACATPTFENTFKRLHLDLKTGQNIRLIPMDHWDACARRPAYLGDRPCWCGLDLATVDDLAALAMVFPGKGETYDVVMKFWCPRWKAVERQAQGEITPYLTWADQGLLTLTDDPAKARPGLDYDRIERDIVALRRRYNIEAIAFDPYNASQLVKRLEDQRFEMIAVQQSMAALSAPTKYLLRALGDERLRHGGNPVLRWMASNTAGREDEMENVKPVKKHSGDKIDGIVALITALALAMGRGNASGGVNERGLLMLD